MAQFIPLSKSSHRAAGVVFGDFGYALEQAAVPLVVEELPQVLPTMVVAFTMPKDGYGFDLAALQSLQGGLNVYIHTNGQWIGGYSPAWYRTHPFRLLKDQHTDRLVVCVDEASAAFQKQAGKGATKLFDDAGELTQRMRNTVTFLEKLQKATDITQVLVRQLDEAGLIVPWEVTTRSPDSEVGRQVQGLYHIDESALKSLDPSTLAKLAASGALSVAYAQLLSEHRLQGLSRLYDLRREAKETAGAVDDVDLEDLFGDDDDDLSFKF